MEKEDIISIILGIIAVICLVYVVVNSLKEYAIQKQKFECYETYLIDEVKLKRCESIFEELYREKKS